MLFYLLMHFLNPVGESLPNPFVDYSYGIGVNICIELALIGISILLFKIIKNRTNKTIGIVSSIGFWLINYLIVWSCFWIESFTLAAGISVFAVVGFDLLFLIVLDLLYKNKR